MKIRYLIGPSLILLCFVTISLAGAPPTGVPTHKSPDAYKGLTDQGIAKLKAGEILILKNIEEGDKPSGMIEAALILDQNIEKVWELNAEKADWQHKYLPYLDYCSKVPDTGDKVKIDFKLVIMGVEMKYRVSYVIEKEKYSFHWALDPEYDNDLKVLKGYWNYYWIDDTHTLCRYGTWFETGLGVPKFVQGFLIKRDLPQSLTNVKKFVNSGGTWRKEGYKRGD